MPDQNELVAEAEQARWKMQLAKKTAKVEVRMRYATVISREVNERMKEVELEFAQALRKANDAGVPQSVIRSEILRTNAWNIWVYWRDLAGIPAARAPKGDSK